MKFTLCYHNFADEGRYCNKQCIVIGDGGFFITLTEKDDMERTPFDVLFTAGIEGLKCDAVYSQTLFKGCPFKNL